MELNTSWLELEIVLYFYKNPATITTMKIKTVTTKEFVINETEAKVIHDIFSQLSKNDLRNLLSNSCTNLMFKGGIDAANEHVYNIFFALNEELRDK